MDLDPTTTAVLALHWQNDIVSPKGRFAPTFSTEADRTGVIPRCAHLLDAARRAGTLVVYTRVCFRPGYTDLVANGPLLAGCRATGALVDGEWGADVLDELRPHDTDHVVSHRRISGFYGSELDTILRANSIDALLLTGVATNFTVLNTAFDAVNAGYEATVVTDCCSTSDPAIHEAAVHTIEVIGASTTADVAMAALEASR
jgi:nicotinamidase-related amidase